MSLEAPPSSAAPVNDTSSDSAFGGSEASLERGEDCIQDQRRAQAPHRRRSVQIDRQKDLSLRQLNPKITEQEIHNISSLFGPEWKRLGRELGFAEVNIKSFAEYENYTERAHAMLIAFIQGEGKRATRTRLIEALEDEKVGRRDIAEKLQEGEELEVKHKMPLVLYPGGNFTAANNDAGNFILCTDKDGQMFLVCPVDGSEFKQACENLLTAYNDAKKAILAHSTVASEHQRQTRSIEQKLSHDEQKLQQLKEDLDTIITHQSSQEHREDYVIVPDDVKECSKLVDKLQNNCTEVLRLTTAACRLTEPLNMKTEMCEHSIRLSFSHRDLEERIIWLKDKASRNPELVDESKELKKILKQCLSLGKEIKMRERFCHNILQNEYSSEQERTQSEPVRRRPPLTETTWRPNSSIESTSSSIEQTDSSSEETAAPTQQARPQENNESEA